MSRFPAQRWRHVQRWRPEVASPARQEERGSLRRNRGGFCRFLASPSFKKPQKEEKFFLSEADRAVFLYHAESRRGHRLVPVPGSRMALAAKMAAGSGFTRSTGRQRVGGRLRRSGGGFCCAFWLPRVLKILQKGTDLFPVKRTWPCFSILLSSHRI